MTTTTLSDNAVWLVTGCSTGIGASLASHIAKTSNRIVATARKIEALSFLPDAENVLKVKLDVTSDEDIKAVFAAALKKFGRIDVVVNNAGYGLMGDAEGIPESDARAQLETNFWGPVKITREAVRVFRDENPKGAGGLVIQVSSMGGYLSVPGGSFYHASKFALEGFTEAIAKEVLPSWNIRFLILEPGGVKTDFAGRSLVLAPRHPAYDNNPEAPFNQLMTYLSSEGATDQFADVDVVARVIFDSVSQSASRPLPLRLPIGSDAWGMIKADTESVSKSLDEWAEVSKSTSSEAQLNSVSFLWS